MYWENILSSKFLLVCAGKCRIDKRPFQTHGPTECVRQRSYIKTISLILVAHTSDILIKVL